MRQENQPTLTGILIQDPVDRGYTAFLAELPEVIAEGDTKELAKEQLLENLKVVLDYRRNESKNTYADTNYSTESFDIAVI